MTALAAWLYANVLGNLVASAIWAAPAGILFVWHHRRITRRLDALHHRLGPQPNYPAHLRRLTNEILDKR